MVNTFFFNARINIIVGAYSTNFNIDYQLHIFHYV